MKPLIDPAAARAADPWAYGQLAGAAEALARLNLPAPSLDDVQPPAAIDRPLRWAKAAGAWHNLPGNGAYVDCWIASDAAADSYDGGRRFRVLLPRSPGCDPNVTGGQVIACAECDDGALVAVSGYLDAAIGTIRLWAADSGLPPTGWTECVPGGTSSRPSPSVTLNGRFPLGRDTAEADLDAVGKLGGTSQRVHSHGLKRNLSGANPTYSNVVNEGLEVTTLLTNQEAQHWPAFGVVRFIERYDNSA